MSEEAPKRGSRFEQWLLGDSLLLKEMCQFRAIRWIIAFFIIGISWLLDTFSSWMAWKAWTAVVLVLGLATYFEVLSLMSNTEEERTPRRLPTIRTVEHAPR